MKYIDFLNKAREKFPMYPNIDDSTLISKLLEKYPIYRDQIEDMPGFDPEGTGYDDARAKQLGYKRSDDPSGRGHLPSLDSETGMVLKGRANTKEWDLMAVEEEKLGNKIVKGEDGRYYSIKSDKPNTVVENILTQDDRPTEEKNEEKLAQAIEPLEAQKHKMSAIKLPDGNTPSAFETVNTEIDLWNQAFTGSIENILVGKKIDKAIKPIADYFDRFRDEDEKVSDKEILANIGEGATNLMTLPAALPAELAENPIAFGKHLLEFFAVETPGMVNTLITAAQLNPVVQTRIAFGDESAKAELEEAQQIIARYPVEHAIGPLMMKSAIKGMIKAPGVATTAINMVKDSNWYRKLTIEERGLVSQVMEEVIVKNPGMSEAELARMFPEKFKESLQKRVKGEDIRTEPKIKGFVEEVGEPGNLKNIHEANRKIKATDDLIVEFSPEPILDIWSKEKLIDAGYDPVLFEEAKLIEGDKDYVEGQELYRLEQAGQLSGETDGPRKAVFSSGASQDAYVEDAIVEHIYKKLKEENPELLQRIEKWQQAVELAAAELGVPGPVGVELFSQAYTFNRLGYAEANPDIAEAFWLPEDIIRDFDTMISPEGVEPIIGETIPEQIRLGGEPAGDIQERGPPVDAGVTYSLKPKSLSNQKYATIKGFIEQLTKEGEPARYWYEQSGQALLDITDGNVEQAKQLLSIIAITSPQMDVKTNFGQAIKGYYKAIRGDEPLAGRFPGGMSKKIQKVMDGEEWEGLKTDKFYKNLTAVIEGGTPDVTVDMWMMRAFGIDKDNPTNLEYRKIEKLVQDIADELGWEPYQVQAAIWTATKARWESIYNPMLAKAKRAGVYLGDGKWKSIESYKSFRRRVFKKMKAVELDPNKIAKAGFDFANAVSEYKGRISHEVIPHPSTGILEGIQNAPYEQQLEYHKAINDVLTDENGRDIIAKTLGIPEVKTFDAPGFYEGESAPAAHTEVLFSQQKKHLKAGQLDKVINEETVKNVELYSAIRGLITKQQAIGYTKEFSSPSKKLGNAVSIEIDGNISTEQLQSIYDKIRESGVDTGPMPTDYGFVIVNFMGNDGIPFSGIDNNTFFETVVNSTKDVLKDTDLIVNYGRLTSLGKLIENDWSVNKNGEIYRQRIYQGRRSDIAGELVSSLNGEIDQVNRHFSEKYNWGRKEEITSEPTQVTEEAQPLAATQQESYRDTRIPPGATYSLKPAQKKYFKDTKVVDDKGDPLVVYHGTGADFKSFHDGYSNMFSPSPEVSSFYASRYDPKTDKYLSEKGGRVAPVYLDIKNPLEFTDDMFDLGESVPPSEFIWMLEQALGKEIPDDLIIIKDGTKYDLLKEAEGVTGSERQRILYEAGEKPIYEYIDNNKPLIEYLESEGYDGIFAKEFVIEDLEPNADDVYIAFRPEQIKSVFNEKPAETGTTFALRLPEKTAPAPKDIYGKKPLKKRPKKEVSTYTKAVVPIDSRLKRIDPSLKRAIRKFEYNNIQQTKTDRKAVEPFVKKMHKLPKQARTDLDLALKNSDPEKVLQIAREYNFEKEYVDIINIIDEIYVRAKDSGMDIGFIEDYFPRKVINLDGLMGSLNKEVQGIIDKAITDKEKSLDRKLDTPERAAVINQIIGRQPSKKRPGYADKRAIINVDHELNQFYEDSEITLLDYIDSMNEAISVNNFFGKGNNKMDSIGAYVDKLVSEGKIKKEQQEQVLTLFRSRFNRGVNSSWLAPVKNLTYMGTMGSTYSAITQLGDFAYSLANSGFVPTRSVSAAARSLIGKSKITVEDIGIEKIAQEFETKEGTSKYLDFIFKWIGLQKLDRIGKESIVNAYVSKTRSQAKRNSKALNREIADVLGEDAVAVTIKDLKSGEITENVLMLAFNKLVDYHPVTLSSMPQTYLENKTGHSKLYYQLKTFTIRQLDVFRNKRWDAFDKAKTKTDRAAAVSDLIKVAGLLWICQLKTDEIKDWLAGREVHFDEIAIDNLLKLFGANRFTVWQARTYGVTEAAVKYVLPPQASMLRRIQYDAMDIWASLIDKDDPATTKDEDTKVGETLRNLQSWNFVPFIGKHYYWRYGGGSKKVIKQEMQYWEDVMKKRSLNEKEREQYLQYVDLAYAEDMISENTRANKVNKAYGE